eukprot:202726-Rhodomonas_salina.3
MAPFAPVHDALPLSFFRELREASAAAFARAHEKASGIVSDFHGSGDREGFDSSGAGLKGS